MSEHEPTDASTQDSTEHPEQEETIRLAGTTKPKSRRRLVILGATSFGLLIPLVLVLIFVSRPKLVRSTNPVDYGAVGNGVTDDAAALQKAFDSVAAGGTVIIPAGRVFAHSQVLTLGRKNVRVTGGGTLLATNEETSEVLLKADGIEMDSITLAMGATTRRWDAYEQMKLRIANSDGVTVSGVTIDGSAAAGVFVGGAKNFRLIDLQVRNTRADGIHVTEGSRDGVVTNPVVTESGDDGVAVVSYRDYPVCERITISGPRVSRQSWGRALSVVGGRDVTIVDFVAEYSSAAGLYVAAEANFNTHPVTRFTASRGALVKSNQNESVDHGAVLLYNGQPGTTNSDITISDVIITDTRPTASRNVAILNDTDASHERVLLDRFTINDGPATPFYSNAPESSYRLRDWLVNGLDFASTIC